MTNRMAVFMFKNFNKNVAAWIVAFSAYTIIWIVLEDWLYFLRDLSNFQLFENAFYQWKGYEFLAAILAGSGYAILFICGIKQRSVSMLWLAFWLSIISQFTLMFVPGGGGQTFINDYSISQAIPFILPSILNIYSIVAILLVLVINILYKNSAHSENKRLLFSGLFMGCSCALLVLLGRAFLGILNLMQSGVYPFSIIYFLNTLFIIVTHSPLFWEALISGSCAGILAALAYRRFTAIPIKQAETTTIGIPEGT